MSVRLASQLLLTNSRPFSEVNLSLESIITLSGTVVTVLIAAIHLGGRITAIETKVDLLMKGLINTGRDDVR